METREREETYVRGVGHDQYRSGFRELGHDGFLPVMQRDDMHHSQNGLLPVMQQETMHHSQHGLLPVMQHEDGSSEQHKMYDESMARQFLQRRGFVWPGQN